MMESRAGFLVGGARPLIVWILGLAALVSITTPVKAQTVAGVVQDGDGQPLESASVILRDALTGSFRHGVATARDGSYRFDSVSPGRYEVTVSYLGYREFRYGVEVGEGDSPVRDVILDAAALAQQEVVITASRARARVNPVTFTNLTSRDIKAHPDMKDIPVILSTTPSVTYHTENGNGVGYSTLRLRGFDQRRISVSINGIPQNDPEAHDVFWINFFDVNRAAEDIQVQRGAVSSQYGSTGIGGAINIVARPYRPTPHATLEVGYGSFDTRRYSFEANSGLLGGRYILFGRASRLRSEGYRRWSWTEFWRFFGGITRYGDRSTLTIQAYGGPQKDGLAYSGIPKAANDDTIDSADGPIDRRYNYSEFAGDLEYFRQPHVELHHEVSLSKTTSFSQALFWIKGEGYFDFGGEFRSADYLRLPDGFVPDDERDLPLYETSPDTRVLFRAYLDQWQIGWLPRMRFRSGLGETTLGAEARLHRSLRWGRIEEGSDDLPAEVVGEDADARVYQFKGEKLIGSLSGSHYATPYEWLAVQADLQLTVRQYRVYEEAFFGNEFGTPYFFANPRLGLTLLPERPLSGHISVAWANREPRLKTLYDGEEAGAGFEPQFEKDATGSYDYMSPLVGPERLLDIEAGVHYRSKRWSATGTVFWMYFRDEIVPSGGLDQFGIPRTGNAEKTRHVGVEIELATRLTRHLEVRANATFSDNRYLRFTEYALESTLDAAPVSRDGNPIPGYPANVGAVAISYDAAGFSANLYTKLAGKQYVDSSGGVSADGVTSDDLTVDPYVLVDLSMAYRLPLRSPLGGLELAVDVNNVLGARVLMYGNVGAVGPQFFPIATRHVFGRVTYTIK
jgi:iron complex outermembrane receptor protein